jgi:hypothetical protein
MIELLLPITWRKQVASEPVAQRGWLDDKANKEKKEFPLRVCKFPSTVSNRTRVLT